MLSFSHIFNAAWIPPDSDQKKLTNLQNFIYNFYLRSTELNIPMIFLNLLKYLNFIKLMRFHVGLYFKSATYVL